MMQRDIKAVIVLLSTQATINLGEIPDPITKQSSVNLEKAKVFVDLLNVLKEKTRGNLTEEEEYFLDDILNNLDYVYEKKRDRELT